MPITYNYNRPQISSDDDSIKHCNIKSYSSLRQSGEKETTEMEKKLLLRCACAFGRAEML
jgi:hypothetical protein